MEKDQRIVELFKRTASGIKPGLETTTALLQALGNPQDSLACLHVAGTNGKGSVAAMLESILRQAGFKTGIYTSPHLVEFNERIKIDGVPVGDATLVASLDRVEQADREQVAAGGRPATFFEMATAMAFDCFRECGVQLAVVETGMGGRWDATNVINPLISIITPISMEHENYLGSDILQIASEKAGIIKSGVPVVVAEQLAEVMDLLAKTAKEKNAILKEAGKTISINRKNVSLEGQQLKIESQNQPYPPIRCPLLGECQVGNCAVAVAGAESLFEIFESNLPAEIVKSGIENVSWPGRGQIVETDPLVVLDGAHNPAAARELKRLLKEIAGKRKLGMVLAFLQDKDVRAFMRNFAGWVDTAWIVEIDNPRAMDAASVREAVEPFVRHCQPCASLGEAYAEACGWASAEEGIVCITGSLYLVGEFMLL